MASRRLAHWLSDNTDVLRSSPQHVHQSLLSTTRAAHRRQFIEQAPRIGGHLERRGSVADEHCNGGLAVEPAAQMSVVRGA
jgi:hypothetical protein